VNIATPISACPACTAQPVAQSMADRKTARGDIILSLPGIHCAACIGIVERGLALHPDVKSARVNLSLKRVTIDAKPGVEAEVFVNALNDLGYDALELDARQIVVTEADKTTHDMLMRLAVAGFAMMNVMLFSVAVWSGASEATRVMFHWISAGIAVPALVYSAQVFFKSAWTALRARRLNMDVPISLAIILAAGLSVYETAQGSAHVYFDAALSLTFFLLIGRYLDHRMRMAARSAAQELSALELPRAVRLRDGVQETVDVADLRVGDQIVVRAGMRIPVDGVLVSDEAQVDRSFLTGESLAMSLGTGDMLSAGEVNLGGVITLQATAVGQDTTLRRMAALVEIAETARNRYTSLADKAAQIYAPVVHLLALFAFVGWALVSSDVALALRIAISVLIITCPCALGLAVPAVMTAASGRLFRHGLLVKNGTALERLAEVDTVLFDKTGTLTQGQAVLDLATLDPDTVSVLAGLAAQSNHPVARAITAAIPEGVGAAQIQHVVEIPGCGVSGVWNDQIVRLGRAEWTGGKSSPSLRIGRGKPEDLEFKETLREGAVEVVQALQARGYRVQIFSGDMDQAVSNVAEQLGISERFAGVMPKDKFAAVEALEAGGARVLMVGDGLNDTAALTRAHASISPASAYDASRTASDIILLGHSLAEIAEAVDTARAATSRVKENFGIAVSYNLIAIPLAVLGFATPLMAALAMSLSSITVIANALRVR